MTDNKFETICTGDYGLSDCLIASDSEANWDFVEAIASIPVPRRTIYVALCEGRHPIPQATDGAIFGSVIEDVTAVYRLEEEALKSIQDICSKAGVENCIHINLYVTGLTVALIAVLNAVRRKMQVTLWHYNNATGEYYSQEVE